MSFMVPMPTVRLTLLPFVNISNRLTWASVDIAYEDGINGAAYSWDAVTGLNSEPNAQNNADSFAFYVAGKCISDLSHASEIANI